MTLTLQNWREEFKDKFTMSGTNGPETTHYLFRVNPDNSLSIALPENVQDFISTLLLIQQEETKKEIEESVFGELNRSELNATVSSMGRAMGHTYSAVNGVKNSHNAVLVIAHNQQRSYIQLPKEQMVTLEDIKKGKLQGTGRAMVIDNYALFEMERDLRERIRRILTPSTAREGDARPSVRENLVTSTPQPTGKLPRGFKHHRKYELGVGFSDEVLCPHGIGHDRGVHGCDGCCSELFKDESKEKEEK